MNESTRQKKVARLLQKDLGEILQVDKKNILNGKFVTVTDVDVSPDLSVAKIYLSMMLVEKPEELIDMINKRKSELRKELGNRIGKQMRIVPELIFLLDQLQEEANRIDQIIDNLEIPPEEENSEEEV